VHLPPTEVRQPQLWDRIRTWVALTETLFTPDQLARYGLQDATAEVLVAAALLMPSCLKGNTRPHSRGPHAVYLARPKQRTQKGAALETLCRQSCLL